MDGNSAKKAPILDRLVGTSNDAVNASTAPIAPSQTKLVDPTLASNNGMNQTNRAKNTTPVQQPPTPKNRRTDKSQFEIELTQIVNRIMNKHFQNASEEIVQQVLREVRARLPGQRKD